MVGPCVAPSQVAAICVWVAVLSRARIRHQYHRIMRARYLAEKWKDVLMLYLVGPDQSMFWSIVDLLEDWFQVKP